MWNQPADLRTFVGVVDSTELGLTTELELTVFFGQRLREAQSVIEAYIDQTFTLLLFRMGHEITPGAVLDRRIYGQRSWLATIPGPLAEKKRGAVPMNRDGPSFLTLRVIPRLVWRAA